MNRRWILLAPLTLLSLSLWASSGDYKVEKVGECKLEQVSEEVRKTLNPEGLRVTSSAGVVSEIWFRSTIPQRKGSSGTDYSTIESGTFVGVIHYPNKGGDYRGQAVRVGTYTLRFQTIPQDGNHLGVSPLPDFLLLVPAAADPDPGKLIPFDELVELSKKASGTNHPNPLNLTFPIEKGKTTFREGEGSTWALETTVKAGSAEGGQSKDFPIALILIGRAEG